MGLAERRAAKEFETKRFPQHKQDISTAAGFEVPVEVNWDALAIAEQAHLYDESWSKVYFKPLVEALKAITIDDLGREAVRASLKKIVVTNLGGTYYGDRMASFQNGVLTLNHEPTTNVDDVEDRKKGIQKTLEAVL